MTREQAFTYLSHWIASRADPAHPADARVIENLTLLQARHPVFAADSACIGWFIKDYAHESNPEDRQALDAWHTLRGDPCPQCHVRPQRSLDGLCYDCEDSNWNSRYDDLEDLCE